MGDWSQTRFRTLLFNELRVETRYMTPKFMLLDEDSNFPVKSMTFWDKVRIYWFPMSDQQFKRLFPAQPIVCDKASKNSGDDQSYESTTTKNPSKDWGAHSEGSESAINPREGASVAGWVTLLEVLRDLDCKYKSMRLEPDAVLGPPRGKEQQIRSISLSNLERVRPLRPAIQPWRRSWDLMPPDVLRPLATSTLGDVLVLAHRLRIVWRVLEPAKRIMQGDSPLGYSFSALEVRGLGLVLEFTRGDFFDMKTENRFSNAKKPPYVPSQAADKMAFGIIPGCQDLHIDQDFPLGGGKGDFDLIQTMHESLGVNQETRDKLTREGLARNSYTELVGFSDAHLLLPPFIPLPGLGAVRIVPPHFDNNSVLMHKPGVRVIFARLKKYIEKLQTKSDELVEMDKYLDEFRKECPVEFENAGFFHFWFSLNAYQRPEGGASFAQRILEMLRRIHGRTTEYFIELMKRYPLTAEKGESKGLLYRNLVAAHIEMAVCANREEQKKAAKDKRKGEDAEDLSQHMFARAWMSETAHLYADHHKKVVDSIINCHQELESKDARQDIQNAWWMLMIRGIVWNMSLFRVLPQGYPLPSQFYGSQSPVFIA